MVRRFERQTQLQTGVINPDAGADGEALAAELESFAARRQTQLDQLAEEQGYQAGLTAGAEGELGDQNARTIRGRAFARGALVAHQAAVQTDIRDSIGRYAIESPDDPDAFDAKVEGLREGLLQEADPIMRAFIQDRLADYAGRAKLNVLDAQQRKLHAEAAADLERGADGFLDDATTAAFEGNVPMIEARRQELDRLLEQGVAGELLTEGDAAEYKQTFERAVTAQEVVGNFDRLIRSEGSEAGTAAIRRWQDVPPSEVGLTADDHEAVTRQLITLKNRFDALAADEAHKNTAAFRAELSTRRDRVNDAISVMRSGFSPDDEQLKQVLDDLRWLSGSGDEEDQLAGRELGHDFDTAAAIADQVHRFRRMPAPARAEELTRLESALRREGASVEEVALMDALEDVDAKVNAELETDPRGYVNREGLITDQPLDFSSAEALAESIDARGGQAELGVALTGRALPRLTSAEADQLAQVYQAGEIEERVAILGTLTAGAGEDVEATLEQLDQKGHKRMALLGSFVMQGQGLLAREIMRGEAVRAADPGIEPKRTDYQGDVDDTIGAALGDWPDVRAQYLDAAVAKYAELKSREGDLSDVYDPTLFRQALEAVLPTGRFNGRRVAIPAGATERTFRDWTRTWTPEQFQGVAGGDPETLLDLVRDRGRLVELGNGQYGVSISSAADERDRVLVLESGEPFILTYAPAED